MGLDVNDLALKVEELTRADETIKAELRQLQLEIDQLEQRTKIVSQTEGFGNETKLNYLTEVNEQLFQQNVRIRQMIERCIDTNTVPTHEEYLKVLQGDT
ncbi:MULTISPECIES: hypothetical protein [Sutcliffiella]|uniref:Uncharacterized protein n=1 Tax=Sutcliffiella cohnii TaxID=33932 RepID=A0A223KN08_9BACI|nr:MULTISPECIES: hypothetical protein [Sutcliffiella]AST90748.1 hypothetical protein BC6307_05345 [Sutcliffiella cohnii]WBL16534.1 hypothetical protein O1A01_07860 [Sutcliffiella sp. NC1]